MPAPFTTLPCSYSRLTEGPMPCSHHKLESLPVLCQTAAPASGAHLGRDQDDVDVLPEVLLVVAHSTQQEAVRQAQRGSRLHRGQQLGVQLGLQGPCWSAHTGFRSTAA